MYLVSSNAFYLQMTHVKGIEKFVHVVLFMMLCKVDLVTSLGMKFKVQSNFCSHR